MEKVEATATVKRRSFFGAIGGGIAALFVRKVKPAALPLKWEWHHPDGSFVIISEIKEGDLSGNLLTRECLADIKWPAVAK